ncbi:MAG TPA: PASTA domain-containing protein [Candidatus Hydrogenedentes bacterium]|nr:PASTA domain-containing protein [Candidatus Hydrogenedentota bacterium]
MRKQPTTYASYQKLTEDRSRLKRTFLISLLLHALAIGGLYFFTLRTTPKPIEIYKVQLVAGEQPEKVIAEPEPTPPPPPEPPKPEPPKETPPPPEPPKPEPPKPEPPKPEKPEEKPQEPQVEVPNLVGMDLKQAENKLKEAGLRLGKVEKKCDDKTKTEKVIAQATKAGTKVKKDSGIGVTVQGPCEEEKKPEKIAKKTEPKPKKPEKTPPKTTPPKDLKPIVPKEEPIKPIAPPKNEPAPRKPAPGKQARANDRVSQSGAAEVPTALQSWLARVMDKVDRNWIIPEGVRRDEVVDIYFVASREGRLLDGPNIVPRNGVMPDPVLAQSAIDALRRSLPLPPFPDDYPGFEQAVVLGFKASQGDQGM